jgi:hypothetical protein
MSDRLTVLGLVSAIILVLAPAGMAGGPSATAGSARTGRLTVSASASGGGTGTGRTAFFNRTNTGRPEAGALSSQGVRVARSGASSGMTLTSSTRFESALHPYSSEAEQSAESQAYASANPQSRYSSQPPATPPMPEPPPRSTPRNYFPESRPGRTMQPPLTLTTRPFMYPGCQCTPGRGSLMASSSGHHR